MEITKIEDEISTIINKDNPENFIYDFLSVYDFPKSTVTKLKKGTNNLAKDDNDVHLKNKLYFKNSSGNLYQDYNDVKTEIDNLSNKPRYIIVTDFKHLLARDTKTGDSLDIEFKQLPQKFEFFLAWNGIEKVDFDKENPADIRAAERFAKLYDVVVKDNPDINEHGLNLFLIRVLFCLFAEDTGIFQKNLFTNQLKALTKQDGSDLNDYFRELFKVLDFPKNKWPKDIPNWIKEYPYVNGSLFREDHVDLKFTTDSRQMLIDAGEKLEWDTINPDILGSMLQAVASENTRSNLGMHYTSVPNIMKVIKPLFLDELMHSFEQAKGSTKKLQDLYARIGQIKFMDPACGSGNFLIITYKELRRLEIEIIKELNNLGLSTMYVPSVTLDQFYGIELIDFACDVTQLSLWIAEHQMNKELHDEIKDAVRPTLPLKQAGAIVRGNALRLDWNEVLPHEKDDEVYLFGNPPYVGTKYQTKENKKDMEFVFSSGLAKYKKLDYVCAWYYLGSKYIGDSITQLSFVSTNSIFEGEQVGIFWPYIKKMGINFKFAYESFVWKNNAKNNAGVTVTISGLYSGVYKLNKSFYYKDGTVRNNVESISPYLSIGDYVIVNKSTSKKGFPKMQKGNAAIDGGFLTFNKQDYEKFITKNPSSKKLFKKYMSASDLIKGDYKYCLWIEDSDLEFAKSIPDVYDRILSVERFRKDSNRDNTKKLSLTPWKFGEIRWENKPQLLIPVVSSESRSYIPISYQSYDFIPSAATFVIYDAPLWLLGLLESRMHMTWLRAIGGKLETRYRYSAGLVYNTFPVPELSTRRKNEIESLVWKILEIREEEGGTLAELYGSPLATKNPKPMNPRLLAAHEELDKVVDRAYKAADFKDDNERLSLLLKMYQAKVNENGK